MPWFIGDWCNTIEHFLIITDSRRVGNLNLHCFLSISGKTLDGGKGLLVRESLTNVWIDAFQCCYSNVLQANKGKLLEMYGIRSSHIFEIPSISNDKPSISIKILSISIEILGISIQKLRNIRFFTPWASEIERNT